MTIAIQIEGLSKSYQGVAALDRLGLQVNQGAAVGAIGFRRRDLRGY
jgi:ABC-type branched-subunit amino acid transport system ATPase component